MKRVERIYGKSLAELKRMTPIKANEFIEELLIKGKFGDLCIMKKWLKELGFDEVKK